MKKLKSIKEKCNTLLYNIRKNIKFKSLTMRIWISFTAIILIVIFGVSFFNIIVFQKIGMNEKMENLFAVHNIILNKSENFDIDNDSLKSLKESRHYIYRNGLIQTLGRQNFSPAEIETAFWIADFAKGDLDGNQYIKKYKDEEVLFIISSIGSGYFISYLTLTYDNTLVAYMLLIGVVFILSGFFAAKVVATKIGEPLLQLEEFTKKIASKNWSDPIVISNQDEIGRLAESMNKMQSDLKRAEFEEQNFLQSISHDLKTPVMVILSHADAIIDGVYVDSLEHTAKIIKDEAINLNKKIRQLLYLNTLAYTLENRSNNEEFDLMILIDYIVSRMKLSKSGIKWNVNAESTFITADYDKITTAIENIIDNALRYADTQICINLKDRNLEIYNDGSHLSDEDLNKIFDNMYMGDKGNFGLGLAISKKTMEFYHWSIKAYNRERGVSFNISFK